MNLTIPTTSFEWVTIFYENAQVNAACDRPRVNAPLSEREREIICRSLLVWQREESSVSSQVRSSAWKYAVAIGDPAFRSAVELYIREEQRHGAALGKWLDEVGISRATLNPSVSRLARAFTPSYVVWTTFRVYRETIAEMYYAALKRLTSCPRLKVECAQILANSETQIQFHGEHLARVRGSFPRWAGGLLRVGEAAVYAAASVGIWIGHGELFREAGISFFDFIREAAQRFCRLQRLMNPERYDFGPIANYEQWRIRLEEVRI